VVFNVFIFIFFEDALEGSLIHPNPHVWRVVIVVVLEDFGWSGVAVMLLMVTFFDLDHFNGALL
jgi:hypothetical protein